MVWEHIRKACDPTSLNAFKHLLACATSQCLTSFLSPIQPIVHAWTKLGFAGILNTACKCAASHRALMSRTGTSQGGKLPSAVLYTDGTQMASKHDLQLISQSQHIPPSNICLPRTKLPVCSLQATHHLCIGYTSYSGGK